MYRPSQTPRLTLSSEQVAQARPVPPRRETGGPSLGARSVDNSMVRFPLHRDPAETRPYPATSHLCYTSHVSSQSQTRVKLNRVFFPR
ncbi:hypothetical protein HPB49_024259 [Dermacentor silvarum]|uniref:Uncharacterized protein n=2 Tax=Dermacentor silvarum TaxID=543639 RepID=A0ACB8CZ57_DERSI|nr:hypothetical protein HPB49_017286 [Dermacentor silvarum]KAH7955055.1 hypothetical protein HPB49_024259 [Dermacentor silvarum]